MIFPDFSLDLTHFLIQFLANKMQDFRNFKFTLHNCILIFDAEHLYLNQASNFKNKDVTANPKPETLKNWFFRKP